MVKRRPLGPDEPSKIFTEEKLRQVARDLESGRLPRKRTTICDDKEIGLRALVSKTGTISFQVSYHLGNSRPNLDLGELNPDSLDHISIDDARDITKIIKALAEERGINPQ